MEFYPFFISFLLVFLSELGDKTQLLVLSFSAKLKTFTILIGVALGSFFSHGVAILFGSFLGNMQNLFLHDLLQFITYISFIVLGIYTFCSAGKDNGDESSNLKRMGKLSLNYILMIAFAIAIGELGDKTFLASIGLGINYPYSKFYLVLGAILGMVASDFLAIIFGKLVSKKIPESFISRVSGILFFLFGSFGLIMEFSEKFMKMIDLF